MSGGLNLWLENSLNWKITQTSVVVCKVFPFFTYTMLDFSVAIIVIMTGKKLYAVLFPITANKLNSSRKEIITVLLALFGCIIINSHFLFSLELVKVHIINSFNNSLDMCTNSKWDTFYQNYWIYIDAIIYSFLPFVLINIFNVSIIICLVQHKKNRLKLLEFQMQNKSQPVSILEGSSTEITEKRNSLKFLKKKNLNTFHHRNVRFHRRMAIVEYDRKDTVSKISSQRKKICEKNNRRLTIVLFLINISFSIFTMPIVILQIIHQVRLNEFIKMMIDENSVPNKENNTFDLLKACFELLQYLNHSINFFLYCLSGSTFRQESMVILSNFYKCFFAKSNENIN